MVDNPLQISLNMDLESTVPQEETQSSAAQRSVEDYQEGLLHRIGQLESKSIKVELDERPPLSPDHNKGLTWYDVKTGGNVVGSCTLAKDEERHRMYVRSIMVDGYNRKGGVGTAVYLQLIRKAVKEGYDFETEDTQQKLGTRRIWEKLADAGIARVVHPFVPDGGGYFVGKYVVKARP